MSFWSALTGSDAADAANAAAADQYAKQQAAAQATRDAGNAYSSNMTANAAAYDPYVGAGNSALARLMAGLGLGSGGAQFTEAYRALPGYRAGLDTGTAAVARGAGAKYGGTNQGSVLKNLYRFGSNYEDQRSGDYLTRLGGLAGSGLSATGAQVGTRSQGYGGQLQANLGAAGQQFGSAGTIGQGMVAGANAESQGAQNLLNAGLKIGGMALGAFGGGGLGSLMGGSSFANPGVAGGGYVGTGGQIYPGPGYYGR